MTTPITPVPVVVEKWMSRSRYLRWVDAGAAWLALLVAGLPLIPSHELVAVTSAGLVVVGRMLRPLRTRWRPVSGWIGLVVSRSLRPGDRAWFVRDGRADAVLVTARHGARLSIALSTLGAGETISVRRTRVFVVPG